MFGELFSVFLQFKMTDSFWAEQNIRVNEGCRYLTPHNPVLPLARASLHDIESQVGDLQEQRVFHSLRAFYTLHLCDRNGKTELDCVEYYHLV